MVIQNNMNCFLDACTIINLIHIDEDEFLLNKLDNLNYFIPEEVFNEVKRKVKFKIDELFRRKELSKEDYRNYLSKIDSYLLRFRGKIISNQSITDELGVYYYDSIKKIASYKKEVNGELISASCALYYSRILLSKILFFTDDFIAKDDFKDFFLYQQIGQIKDTVDLIILLYWLEIEKDKIAFSSTDLSKYLNNLFVEYFYPMSFLKADLNDFLNSIKIQSKNNTILKTEIAKTLKYIQDVNLTELHKMYKKVEMDKHQRELLKVFKKYDDIFILDKDNRKVEKFEQYKLYLKSTGVKRLLDLLT